jgi:tRNA (guanine-N7-)-methyltransferase
MTTDPTTLNRLYGRVQGHKLRAGQQALMDDFLPTVAVPEGPLNARALFGDDRPLQFEIGFGGGEHLAWQAQHAPTHGLIGCEPFVNGVVSALLHIRDKALPNVRLHMGDALDALARLPDGSLDRVYLLHPDPWPKARHAKRRMMNPGPIAMIAAKLKPGGEFRFGTDHPIYCRWTMMQMDKSRDFEWQAKSARDFLVRPDDWPETRYERKARTVFGHDVWYFSYIRV